MHKSVDGYMRLPQGIKKGFAPLARLSEFAGYDPSRP